MPKALHPCPKCQSAMVTVFKGNPRKKTYSCLNCNPPPDPLKDEVVVNWANSPLAKSQD